MSSPRFSKEILDSYRYYKLICALYDDAILKNISVFYFLRQLNDAYDNLDTLLDKASRSDPDIGKLYDADSLVPLFEALDEAILTREESKTTSISNPKVGLAQDHKQDSRKVGSRKSTARSIDLGIEIAVYSPGRFSHGGATLPLTLFAKKKASTNVNIHSKNISSSLPKVS